MVYISKTNKEVRNEEIESDLCMMGFKQDIDHVLNQLMIQKGKPLSINIR